MSPRATATKPKATAKSAPELPRLYTAEDLAVIFHCSTRTVRRMWGSGELEYVTFRGHRYTRQWDLDRLMETLR